MFLHIGEGEVIFTKYIIAIFDIERTTVSSITRNFLKGCEAERIKTIGKEMPKSFIITMDNKKQMVYLSPISTSTLLKRAEKLRIKNRRS
jgi:hypothetical protein